MEQPYQNQGDGARSSLGELAQGLLSDPALMERIGGILKAASASTEGEGRESAQELPAEPLRADADSIGSPLGADGLAGLFSNPELLEKLPTMIAAMKPMLSSLAPPPPKEAPHRSATDCRNDLLLSLKPFLSEPRQEAVDTILRIARLGALLGQIK